MSAEMNTAFSMRCKWRAACIGDAECAFRKEATMVVEIKEAQPIASANQNHSSARPTTWRMLKLFHPYRNLAAPFPFVELRNTLPSHLGIVSPVVNQLTDICQSFRSLPNFIRVAAECRPAKSYVLQVLVIFLNYRIVVQTLRATPIGSHIYRGGYFRGVPCGTRYIGNCRNGSLPFTHPTVVAVSALTC
jgi:hypothetical protein